MRNKQFVLDLVILLLEENDLDILKRAPILAGESFSDTEIKIIEKIVKVLSEIYFTYDYFKSPLFLNSTKNKSNNYKNIKIKMDSSPVKVKKNKDDFKSAIRNLIISKDLYNYVEDKYHYKIDNIVKNLSELSCS